MSLTHTHGMPIWVLLRAAAARCIMCNFYQGHQPCDPIRFPSSISAAAASRARARCITNSFSLFSRGFILAHTFIYPYMTLTLGALSTPASIIYWLSKQNNILSASRLARDSPAQVDLLPLRKRKKMLIPLWELWSNFSCVVTGFCLYSTAKSVLICESFYEYNVANLPYIH